MKYIQYGIIAAAVGFLVYVVSTGFKGSQQNDAPQPLPAAASQEKKQWETKIDEQPPVAIEVTPLELGQDVRVWKFNVTFTTHSGSLDDDPVAVASLVDDKGNMYQPTAWEGPGPGGHHRAGVLVFNAIEPAPQSIKLMIKNVGGIPERSFEWRIP